MSGIADAGCILTAPIVLGYQAYQWLKTGSWHSIVLADWIGRNQPPDNNFWAWINEPHGWYGLHTIVAFVFLELPVWIFLMVIFFLAGKWIGSEQKSFEKRSL